jgi:ribosomal protein L37AE/L43A
MKIKEKINQNRRDFTAIYVCELCGHEEKGDGYDDSYFHETVIPNKICKNCNKKSGHQSSSPKFSDDVVI